MVYNGAERLEAVASKIYDAADYSVSTLDLFLLLKRRKASKKESLKEAKREKLERSA